MVWLLGVDLRLPLEVKISISELNIQKGSDLGVKSRRENMLHARAAIERRGVLKFQMYHVAKSKGHVVECSVDDWHKLGYGPLEWMGWEMRVFLCERIVSGMRWEEIKVSEVTTTSQVPTLVPSITAKPRRPPSPP